jgi:hypothetical protein
MSKYVSGQDSDRRSGPRTLMQRSGKVLCGGFAWDCIIRDMSPSGARIQMLSSATPPDALQLVDLSSGYAHDSHVAWQKDRELGLRFVRTHDLRGLAPAAFQTAKRLWAAKAPSG